MAIKEPTDIFSALENFTFKEISIAEKWRKDIAFEKLVELFDKLVYHNSKIISDRIENTAHLEVSNFTEHELKFFDVYTNAILQAKHFLNQLKIILGGVRHDIFQPKIFNEIAQYIPQCFVNIDNKQYDTSPTIACRLDSAEGMQLLSMIGCVFILLHELSSGYIQVFKKFVEVTSAFLPQTYDYRHNIGSYVVIWQRLAVDKIDYQIYEIDENGKIKTSPLKVSPLIELATFKGYDYFQGVKDLNTKSSSETE